jgi:hypothetical protein
MHGVFGHPNFSSVPNESVTMQREASHLSVSFRTPGLKCPLLQGSETLSLTNILYTPSSSSSFLRSKNECGNKYCPANPDTCFSKSKRYMRSEDIHDRLRGITSKAGYFQMSDGPSYHHQSLSTIVID